MQTSRISGDVINLVIEALNYHLTPRSRGGLKGDAQRELVHDDSLVSCLYHKLRIQNVTHNRYLYTEPELRAMMCCVLEMANSPLFQKTDYVVSLADDPQTKRKFRTDAERGKRWFPIALRALAPIYYSSLLPSHQQRADRLLHSSLSASQAWAKILAD